MKYFFIAVLLLFPAACFAEGVTEKNAWWPTEIYDTLQRTLFICPKATDKVREQEGWVVVRRWDYVGSKQDLSCVWQVISFLDLGCRPITAYSVVTI